MSKRFLRYYLTGETVFCRTPQESEWAVTVVNLSDIQKHPVPPTNTGWRKFLWTNKAEYFRLHEDAD